MRAGLVARGLSAVPFPMTVLALAVTMYVRFPHSLRNVEDLRHERGIDVCHEAVRFWWHRFGTLFAAAPASIYNLFNSECSPTPGSNFKMNRAAALAGWSGLCAE